MDYTLKKLIEIEDFIDDLQVTKPIDDPYIHNIMIRYLMIVHTHLSLAEGKVKMSKPMQNLRAIEAYYKNVDGSREDYGFETTERTSLLDIEHFVYYLRHEFRALVKRGCSREEQSKTIEKSRRITRNHG